MCFPALCKTHFEILSIFCTVLTFSGDLMIVAIFPTAFFLSAQPKHNREAQEKLRRNRSFQNPNRYGRPIKVELCVRHFWETTWAKGSCYCETPSPWKEPRHLNVEDWSAVSLAIAAPRPFDKVRGAISPEKHVLVSKAIPPVTLHLRSAAPSRGLGSKPAVDLRAKPVHCFRGTGTFCRFCTHLDVIFIR